VSCQQAVPKKDADIQFGPQRVVINCFTYLEQETLLFPVPAKVADIFGNGNNLDGTRASRRLSPHHPPRTLRNRHIAYPNAPDNPGRQNNKSVELIVLISFWHKNFSIFITFKKYEIKNKRCCE